ncbi:MAG: DNA mismatch repair endonuclease MutL [Cyanobacteria bacterium NC_groundwater_1444_Ag_S-0.65um_54_12]|nr:DNA mismatch repair endonuclease MutL [Cyanobacteria bacterium NC_groundwater_1444_Ag_S-0.65um_54_12]
MGKIQYLPEQLANQIAAGEVIERPASAVKELVENAIDAGAARIVVHVAEAGRSLRVSDDGEGMAPEDAPLAFERFATSKIRDSQDLFALASLGFRGEALAAIAAVAKIELMTRRAVDLAGIRIKIAGGKQIEVSPWGCPAGTTLSITELFYNTPARLKFLKSPATETAQVIETVTALALAQPHIHLTVQVNERVALDTKGARDLGEATNAVLGPEVGPKLLPVSLERDAYSIRGFIAPPELVRSDRTKQWLLVNGRPVRHPAITRAIDQAYDGHIPQSRYPIYVIDLRIPPERVDFNVHPTKKEIRLADSSLIYHLMQEAISLAFRQPTHSRSTFALLPASFSASPPVALNEALDVYRLADQRNAILHTVDPGQNSRTPGFIPLDCDQLFGAATGQRSAFPWENLLLLGQLHETYLVLQHPDGLYIVDQHNSHERYLYEQLDSSPALPQKLLFPQTLDLTVVASSMVEEHVAELRELGFLLQAANHEKTEWELRAVPAILSQADGVSTILAILEDMALETALPKTSFGEHSRVMLACRSAIKAGQKLTTTEQQLLIKQWRSCQQPFTCPHGRPTAFLIPSGELNRRCLRGRSKQ